jgi:hypothetical protein
VYARFPVDPKRVGIVSAPTNECAAPAALRLSGRGLPHSAAAQEIEQLLTHEPVARVGHAFAATQHCAGTGLCSRSITPILSPTAGHLLPALPHTATERLAHLLPSQPLPDGGALPPPWAAAVSFPEEAPVRSCPHIAAGGSVRVPALGMKTMSARLLPPSTTPPRETCNSLRDPLGSLRPRAPQLSMVA